MSTLAAPSAPTAPKPQRRPLPTLPALADAINEADAGIEALLTLLRHATGTIPPDCIERLLKPHHDVLRRAADDLADLA